jgi:hypothetical protein
VFDAGADVGAPGEPVDRLADHGIETPAGMLGLSQEVVQAAVAGQRDGDAFVGVATAAVFEGHAAGLDVPEPGGDLPPVG